MELEEAIKLLKEMQESCRYRTYIDNEARDEWIKEYRAIEIVLKELDKKDKVINLFADKVFTTACKIYELGFDTSPKFTENWREKLIYTYYRKAEGQKKLIDLMHCEIVYCYVCKNDGYYWDGFVVLKCDDKYCVVEYKGSQSGWIKNQIESVDKEFLDNVIGNRKLDNLGNIDDDFPSYFNTFLETTYNYPIPDAIMQQLKDQDAILLDFEDIKKHIKEERNAR